MSLFLRFRLLLDAPTPVGEVHEAHQAGHRPPRVLLGGLDPEVLPDQYAS